MVTGCVLTKDSAGTLERCLRSLSEVVDKVVVLDTGSTDNSVAIAEAAGAKVLQDECIDDGLFHFGLARNKVQDACQNVGWALHVDSDEYVEGDRIRLREYLAAEPYEPHDVHVEPHWCSSRLVPATAQWMGRCHEFPRPQPRRHTVPREVLMMHHTRTDWELSDQRNWRLLAKQLEETRDPEVLFRGRMELAVLCFRRNQLYLAIGLLYVAGSMLDEAKSPAYLAWVHHGLSACYSKMGMKESAEHHVRRAEEFRPGDGVAPGSDHQDFAVEGRRLFHGSPAAV